MTKFELGYDTNCCASESFDVDDNNSRTKRQRITHTKMHEVLTSFDCCASESFDVDGNNSRTKR